MKNYIHILSSASSAYLLQEPHFSSPWDIHGRFFNFRLHYRSIESVEPAILVRTLFTACTATFGKIRRLVLHLPQCLLYRVFARPYATKVSKARGVSNAIFGLNHRIGSLPVREGLQLYTARIDCYLISGCEILLDTDSALLEEHLEAQHMFLRRLLGLNPHSMLAVLFTQTGRLPIRIRRLILASAACAT